MWKGWLSNNSISKDFWDQNNFNIFITTHGKQHSCLSVNSVHLLIEYVESLEKEITELNQRKGHWDSRSKMWHHNQPNLPFVVGHHRKAFIPRIHLYRPISRNLMKQLVRMQQLGNRLQVEWKKIYSPFIITCNIKHRLQCLGKTVYWLAERDARREVNEQNRQGPNMVVCGWEWYNNERNKLTITWERKTKLNSNMWNSGRHPLLTVCHFKIN